MEVQESFIFGHWEVSVHRKNFRRSVSIQLYPDKPIKVIAAKSTPRSVIEDFLKVKYDWILKSFQKFEEIKQQFPDKKIQAQENFPFRGVDRKLKVVITLNKKCFVSIDEDKILLHIPRNEWSADSLAQEYPQAIAELRHYYKREAVKHISERVKYWAHAMQLFPSQVRFKEQRTRWGSCSSKGIVNLNWRLIVFSDAIIDYVIIHELAHLKHMNHSQKFWDLVEKHEPAYKGLVKELKDNQRLVEFLAV